MRNYNHHLPKFETLKLDLNYKTDHSEDFELLDEFNILYKIFRPDLNENENEQQNKKKKTEENDDEDVEQCMIKMTQVYSTYSTPTSSNNKSSTTPKFQESKKK